MPSHAPSLHHASWFSLKAQSLFRRFATERVLALSLPDGQLRLGRDLRAAPGHPLIPQLLHDIEHPELGRVFSHYAPASARPRPVRRLGLFSRAGEACSCRRLFTLDAPFSGIDLVRRNRREDKLEQPPPIAARRVAYGQGQVARGTGAQDWASRHQRMRFILELFRSRQPNQRLLEPTFSAAQVKVLERGRIPHGHLT